MKKITLHEKMILVTNFEIILPLKLKLPVHEQHTPE